MTPSYHRGEPGVKNVALILLVAALCYCSSTVSPPAISNVPLKMEAGVYGPSRTLSEAPGAIGYKNQNILNIALITTPTGSAWVAVPRVWLKIPWGQWDVNRLDLFRLDSPAAPAPSPVLLEDLLHAQLDPHRFVWASGGNPGDLRLLGQVQGNFPAGSALYAQDVPAAGNASAPRLLPLPGNLPDVIGLENAVTDASGKTYIVVEAQDPNYTNRLVYWSYLYHSDDGLQTLKGPFQILVPGPADGKLSQDYASSDIDIAPDGTLYVAMYVIEPGGVSRVYLLKSRGGETWQVVNRRVAPQGQDPFPLLSVDISVDPQGGIHIAYINAAGGIYNRQIMYTYSSDGGLTFSTPVNVLGSRNLSVDVVTARIHNYGQRRYVSWVDDGEDHYVPHTNPFCEHPYDVVWLTWSDDGAHFHDPVRVSEIADGHNHWITRSQMQADSGGNLHFAWTSEWRRLCDPDTSMWKDLQYLFVPKESVH